MKNLLALIFAAFIMMISGCDKEKKTNCLVPEIDVIPEEGSAVLNLGYSNYGFYEIEYGPNGFSKGNGTTESVSNGHTITNLNNGTYDIYVRGNCGGSDFSEWSNPTSFIVTGGGSSTCIAPYDLNAYWNATNYLLNWSASAGTGGTLPGYYQVEYGITGFTKGTGTVSNASSNYFSGNFTQGQTYDYYVRSNCGGSDFSSWTGPASFYVEY